MKTPILLLAASALFAATPALAQDASYTLTSSALPKGIFTGTFSLGKAGDETILTAFSASYAGYTYDLSKVGIMTMDNLVLIGGTVNGVNTLNSGTDDFSIGFFDINKLGKTSGLISSADGYPDFASVTIAAVPANPTTSPISPVPEPATWALMLAGFGLTATALRRRRVRFAAVAA